MPDKKKTPDDASVEDVRAPAGAFEHTQHRRRRTYRTTTTAGRAARSSSPVYVSRSASVKVHERMSIVVNDRTTT